MVRSALIFGLVVMAAGSAAFAETENSELERLRLAQLECEAMQRQKGNRIIEVGKLLDCLKAEGFHNPQIRITGSARF
jgi:hypothetical protein